MSNPISIYKCEIEKELQQGQATEHTYRAALVELIKSLNKGITATNEPKHRTDCGAPDIAVSKSASHGPLSIGNIETKDIGVSLDEAERSDQLKRYLKHLPNLILTDYLEFRWYVDGEHRDTKRLARVKDGKLKYEKDGAEAVLGLLTNFIEHPPEKISSTQTLAQRMAHLTHMIRDSVIEAFEKNKATETLRDLRGAFAKTIIPDIDHPDKTPEFADMYAQTLAYGLFAARCNHNGPGPFERTGAAREIPKTNPFLRKLFEMLTGTALEDEPYAGFVEDLVSLLANAEMEAILKNFGVRKGFEDPVVHFYETFLATYDPKLRKSRGVYYTPEPVVSYIVRSVDNILREHFGLKDGLADKATTDKKDEKGNPCPKVLILDPACGTGTFLYAVVDLIREQFKNNVGMWKGYVEKHLLPRLFGFELLMAPYAVAHFKLGMQLAAQDMEEPLRKKWAYDFSSDERLGIFLTNTLEEVEHQIKLEVGPYRIIAEEANAANQIKHKLPIMVIMGNPPYSGNSANKGEWINDLVRDSYYPNDEIKERNPKLLLDDYVKFIRWAQWRIENTGAGVLAFISNHGYLDNPTFRKMRRELMKAFDEIHVLDLHGNSKKKEKCPDGSKDENVFDIQQGVAISLFIKAGEDACATRKAAVPAAMQSAGVDARATPGDTCAARNAAVPAAKDKAGVDACATIYHADLWGLREGKYQTLSDTSVRNTDWEKLEPQAPFYLFIKRDTEFLKEYENGWKINEIMPTNSMGVKTNRDHLLINFNKDVLTQRISLLVDDKISDEKIADLLDLKDGPYWNTHRERQKIRDGNWKANIHGYLYRPFDKRWLLYQQNLIEIGRGGAGTKIMQHMLAGENLAICTNRQVLKNFKHIFCTRLISDNCSVSLETRERTYAIPLYLYPDPNRPLGQFANWPAGKDGRVPNLDPRFIKELESRLGLKFALSRNAAVPAAKDNAGVDARATPCATFAKHYRGYLPHWELKDSVYFVTFRLADSLPRHVIESLKEKRKTTAPMQSEKLKSDNGKKLLDEMLSGEFQHALDSNIGECHLKRPEIAEIVEGALKYFNGQRYNLYCWAIMPNHVHVVFKPLSGNKLSDILHSWKSFSSHEIKSKFGVGGPFWQRESYDHIVRDEEELYRISEYVFYNPQKSGLENWKWVGFCNAAVPAAMQSAGGDARNAAVPAAEDNAGVDTRNAAVPAAEDNAGADACATHDACVTPEDVFNYIYAVFHSPTYRERYREFLKMDFPRVPLTSDRELFRKLCKKGGELVGLHLLESPALSHPLTTYPETGDNLVEKGHPKYLAPGDPEPGTGKKLKKGRVYLNKTQYFEGVPQEVWEFHIGGYQVCHKWLKDRVGRRLSSDNDLNHYQKIIVALGETIRLMKELDSIIPEWPIK